ncbi:ATP-binding cassette domain-containing protein, partial [Kitasatospora sp. NPDC047058]|uniref:ATP-binding cassette domain-containing protein n=1 Tax=Kitasatospora sp. NPDC047058 TaxID=3155620 RepID=UPI0033DF184B
MTDHPPVEYAVAVDRYLAAADLGAASRRVYRIALDTWAWALADRPAPAGPERRRARPPVLPLALLDHPDAAARLRTAVTHRTAGTDPRTLNRELSTLRAALTWWRAQGWIRTDPAAGLRPLPLPGPGHAPLTPDELRTLLARRAPLREQALWHLLHESGAAIETVLALDVDDLDLPRRRTLPSAPPLHWRAGTARLLPLLVAGRTAGPLFLTDRRAPAATPAADRCPHTGRARLSYRRAAELFTAHNPGLTLTRLRPAPPDTPSAPGTTLSGGERQRLKLATHMAEKGGVYVLDEPTA